MSEREAAVKLTLDNGQFITSARKAGDAVEEVAKKGAKSASAWTAGLKGAKDAIGGIGSKVKEVLTLAAGLGGALSLGTGIQQAVSLRTQFMAVETQMNKTGRASVNWRDLMGAAEKQAHATGHTTAEMGTAMEKLFAGVGDADFVVEAMQDIGDAATFTHKSLDQMADVAGMLKEKFGATLESLPDMLAVVAEKTDEGGLSLESMGAKFGLLAGEAADAGYTGAEGLSSVLGMLNALDDRLGDKSIPAFKKLFQILKDGSAGAKALQKDAGIKFGPDMTGLEKMRALMATKKSRDAVASNLGGESRVVFDELSKPFNEAFEIAKKSGADTKASTAAGLKAFDDAMAGMSKHALNADELHKRAGEMVKADPMARLHEATDKFVAALATPEMYEALDKLAAQLPAFAKWVGEFLEMALKHPVATAAAAGGASVAGGAVEAAGGAVLAGVGKSIWGKVFGKAATVAGTAAVTSAATAGTAAAATTAAAPVTAAAVAGTVGTSAAIVAAAAAALPALLAGGLFAAAFAGVDTKEDVAVKDRRSGKLEAENQMVAWKDSGVNMDDMGELGAMVEAAANSLRSWKPVAAEMLELEFNAIRSKKALEGLAKQLAEEPDKKRRVLGSKLREQQDEDEAKERFRLARIQQGLAKPDAPKGGAKAAAHGGGGGAPKVHVDESFAAYLAREFGRTLATTEIKVKNMPKSGSGTIPTVPKAGA